MAKTEKDAIDIDAINAVTGELLAQVSVRLQDTVSTLKQAVRTAAGQQFALRLLAQGVLLTDSHTIEAAGLHDHSQVQVVALKAHVAVTGSIDRCIRLWQMKTGECLSTFTGHESSVTSVCMSSDGSTIASASEDHTARLWDADSGICRTTLAGHSGCVFSVAFSPDGARVVTSSTNPKVWDVSTGICQMTLYGHTADTRSACFSPDGGTVLTGAEDRTARFWDVKNGENFLTLRGHMGPVVSVSFSADGGAVFTAGCTDRITKVWDSVTGECRFSISGHTGNVNAVSCAPDGVAIVTASDDCTAKLWDTQTGECLQTLRGHDGPIRAALFMPDRLGLLTCSTDCSARLWELEEGTCTQVFARAAHSQALTSLSCVLPGAFEPSEPVVGLSSLWHHSLIPEVESVQDESTATPSVWSALSMNMATDLKWLVWNEMWWAGNIRYGLMKKGKERRKHLRKAIEDSARVMEHVQALQELVGLSAGTLHCIRMQSRRAGNCAAECAVTWGNEQDTDHAQKTRVPERAEEVLFDRLDGPPQIEASLWTRMQHALRSAAQSVAEMLREDYFKGRVLQADFEQAWHKLYEVPYVTTERGDNRNVPAVLKAATLKPLPEVALKDLNQFGFAGPFELLNAEEVRICLENVKRLEAKSLLGDDLLHCHVTLPWVCELGCHPKVVGAVASALGADAVLLYDATIHSCGEGEAIEPDWHQEGSKWANALGPLNGFINVTVALTRSDRSSGCAEYFRGHHVVPKTTLLELEPGDFALSRAKAGHRTFPNRQRCRCYQIVCRYISDEVRDLFVDIGDREQRDWALLVCGHDLRGHFRLLSCPKEERGPQEQARWRQVKQLRTLRFGRIQ